MELKVIPFLDSLNGVFQPCKIATYLGVTMGHINTIGADRGNVINMIEDIKSDVNGLKIITSLSQNNEDIEIVNKSLFDNVETLLTLVSKEVNHDGIFFYTIYWKSGDRKVIGGESFEAAFDKAGYDHTSLSIISFIHEGVTNWKWDNRKKVWLEK